MLLQKGLAFPRERSVTESAGPMAALVSRLAHAGLLAVRRRASLSLNEEIPVRSVQSDGVAEPQHQIVNFNPNDRRHFIGGSDARIIMGDDQDALVRLWREKRGEIEPEDLAGNLIVQLGTVTEVLNRAWYQRASGCTVKDIQKRVRHPVHKWMAATLDGTIEQTGAVFEAKFMLPWAFTEEAAAEKHMAQLQHNMWVIATRSSVLSIITGGGKWVEIKIHADPLYQHLLLTAEKKFWRCVQSGEPPVLFNIETPRPRLEAVKVVDMSTSNQWAVLAATYLRTRDAHGEHEIAKADLRKLVPEDAKEAAGHGIKAKRSKSGAVSFEVLVAEYSHASV
jgi:predicted phage-related endonuclease